MAQSKSDMGLDSEISNDTVIHSTVGPCTDLDNRSNEEEEEEEIELAEEVDEYIGMGSEDSTTGKQIYGMGKSPSGQQEDSKLALIIVHENAGAGGKMDEESANYAESREQIEAPNVELEEVVEKTKEELKQADLIVYDPQDETEPPAQNEFYPQLPLQSQNEAESIADEPPVTNMEDKEQPNLQQTQQAVARSLQNQDERSSELFSENKKEKGLMTMEESDNEEQAVEGNKEVEQVVASSEVGLMESIEIKNQANVLSFNDEAMQEIDANLNVAVEHLTEATAYDVQQDQAEQPEGQVFPANDMVQEVEEVVVGDQPAVKVEVKNNEFTQSEKQLTSFLNPKINNVEQEQVLEVKADLASSGTIRYFPKGPLQDLEENTAAASDYPKITEEMSAEVETKDAKEPDVEGPVINHLDKEKQAEENKTGMKELVIPEVSLGGAEKDCQATQKSPESFQNIDAFESDSGHVNETKQLTTVDDESINKESGEEKEANFTVQQLNSIDPLVQTVTTRNEMKPLTKMPDETDLDLAEECEETVMQDTSIEDRPEEKDTVWEGGRENNEKLVEKEQDKDRDNEAGKGRVQIHNIEDQIVIVQKRETEDIGAVKQVSEEGVCNEIEEPGKGVCKKIEQPGEVMKDELDPVVERMSNKLVLEQLIRVIESKQKLAEQEGTKKEQPSPVIEVVQKAAQEEGSKGIEQFKAVTEDEPKKRVREGGRKVAIPAWLIASETSEVQEPPRPTGSRSKNICIEREEQIAFKGKGPEVKVENGLLGTAMVKEAAQLKKSPPVVMQEDDAGPPKTSPVEQMQEKIYSADPSDWEISLYVKAGSDGESIGNCPFSQRLFMILWLKGVIFNVTTVDLKRKPADLQDLAPGTNPPFMTFNSEVLVDVNKIEEFLEERLVPPRYPKLAAKHPESNTAGIDVFAKFSAYIKNPRKEANDEEIDANSTDDPGPSTRSFLDGPDLTLADCNLLPKLHIIKIVAKKYRGFEFPDDMKGIWRYLNSAYQREEFINTCPAEREIEFAYLDVAKKIK
ncbi:uncharacterized protein [Salminus brasiliensis]|uniref:uncharacterized protein isoform X2 n=1 Tax=Salminus brasiliensis TaxID=930266 RepID=UPI003B82E088